ncbi:MAG: hypothetical protein HWN81_20180 [Candidatus Lokiarchaeota archaeon]|nr:hypothetical protein [Candidatus Lokiarchaeota archaeon]
MDPKDSEIEIEKLSHMLSKLQDIYYKKKEQLTEIELEINELREVINFLGSLISGKSFYSADELYSKEILKKTNITKEDQYFVEEIPKQKVEGTNIKRKIFSKRNGKDDELLCILNFYDLNRVEIKLIDPGQRVIKETSEDFIRIFLKGGLIKIKEINPDLTLKYEHFKNTELIEQIIINNLGSINEYDIITSKMRELFAKEISSNT